MMASSVTKPSLCGDLLASRIVSTLNVALGVSDTDDVYGEVDEEVGLTR